MLEILRGKIPEDVPSDPISFLSHRKVFAKFTIT